MRLLIVSDSHGYISALERILNKENEADVVFHLGDGAVDFERFSDLLKTKQVFRLKGNCDSAQLGLPTEILAALGNDRIFACHGHMFSVKSSLMTLMFSGLEKEATICLYGHTHIPSVDYRNGMLFLNPGSAGNGRYATIDLKSDAPAFPSMHILSD